MDISFDPLAEGFFRDESLEFAERIGLALKSGARKIPISFDRNILPQAYMRPAVGGASFTFSDSIRYDASREEELIRLHPEEEAAIRARGRKWRAYQEECFQYVSPRHDTLVRAGAEWGGGWGGHSNPDFGLIVNLGTDGIREKIALFRGKNTGDCDWFYRACEDAMDALDILGGRFRDLALEKAGESTDETEKARCLAAARAFGRVPRLPAENFTEAVHAFWLCFTFDGIDSPGRFDQYMLRCYRATGEAERADMLERLWEAFHDTRAWNLCLSGSDENGLDETNELSYAILRLAREKKYQTPNLTLRVHENTPQRLWDELTETLASGIGMPALYNDATVCRALEKLGIPPEDSHDYCMNGCNQIDLMGKSHMGLEDGEVNFAKALEYALHDGVNALNGQAEGLPTGDAASFESYAELENAFYRQLDFLIHQSALAANAAQEKRAAYQPNPFRSCLIEGCLERGLDYRNGGPLYNAGQILAEGIADAGDSLYAVKKLVFEEKKYTMAELVRALDADFEGYEALRADFAACPRFGNDDAEADRPTVDAVGRFLTVLKRHRCYRGGVFTGGCAPYNRAPGYGERIAALPNGRVSRDPLIADCVSAFPGSDRLGPTALMNSVLKYRHDDCGSGFVFMLKFDRKLFATPTGQKGFQALARAFFAEGGQQLTVTVTDAAELLDAKCHPERHAGLIVRVGGYSDYFIHLDPRLQDNVIARTQHGV